MIKKLTDVPRVTDGDADDPDWHPVTHHFGLTAFGLNAFVAREAGQELIGEHDETGSGQEEVYVVLDGVARFWLDGCRDRCARGLGRRPPRPGDATARRRPGARHLRARGGWAGRPVVRVDVERVALRVRCARRRPS